MLLKLPGGPPCSIHVTWKSPAKHSWQPSVKAIPQQSLGSAFKAMSQDSLGSALTAMPKHCLGSAWKATPQHSLHTASKAVSQHSLGNALKATFQHSLGSASPRLRQQCGTSFRSHSPAMPRQNLSLSCFRTVCRSWGWSRE